MSRVSSIINRLETQESKKSHHNNDEDFEEKKRYFKDEAFTKVEAPKNEQKAEMTDEQIENWRQVLFGMIGPYAIVAPKQVIINIKKNLQSRLNQESLLNQED